MKVLILKSIKNFYRSPSNIIMTIVFPVVMIFFLGTFLQNLDISDGEIGEISLEYKIINSDGNSDIAFLEFLKNAENVTANEADNQEAAKEKIAGGDTDAYIELDGRNINLFYGNNATAGRAITMMMRSFLTMSQTYYNIYEVNPAGLIGAAGAEYKSYTEQSGLGISRSMMDYYAVAMVVMMSFMCFITGISMEIKEEELDKTILRIYISTRSKTAIILSMIVGHILMAAVSVLIAMLTASMLFGAKYCEGFAGNLTLYLMLLCVNLCVIGIGSLIGTVSKITPIGIVIPVSWAMLFYSGSFSKEIFIDGFSQYLPPYLIQQAAFDLTLFSESEKAVRVMAVSLIIFAVSALLSAVLFNRKKVVSA